MCMRGGSGKRGGGFLVLNPFKIFLDYYVVEQKGFTKAYTNHTIK